MFFTKADQQLLKKNSDDLAQLFMAVDLERRGSHTMPLNGSFRGYKQEPTLNEKIRLLYEHLGLEIVTGTQQPAYKIIKKGK